ncbi:hypothetical protein HHI36_007940 [Cryptolaemus montrouzieri]|uniref:Uncharacterized protein n=1 Tax=Cryptolaemus montrouzieri TaxID=559131 RepID=A0ABD2MRH5_9CUCU
MNAVAVSIYRSSSDFNVDFSIRKEAATKEVNNLMFSYGSRENATKPSRICKTKGSCVDNIFTNMPQEINLQTTEIHLSDHRAQLVSFRFLETPSEKNKIIKKKRIFKKDNAYQLRKELSEIDWDSFLGSKDAQGNGHLSQVAVPEATSTGTTGKPLDSPKFNKEPSKYN